MISYLQKVDVILKKLLLKIKPSTRKTDDKMINLEIFIPVILEISTGNCQYRLFFHNNHYQENAKFSPLVTCLTVNLKFVWNNLCFKSAWKNFS